MTHARIAPGCRRLTPAHVQVQAIAERFEGLPEGVSKGQALAALKQAARPLGLSRACATPSTSCSPSARRRIGNPAPADRLAFQPQARDHARPGKAAGAERPQCPDRANLITPVDSPTGRRWGHRDAKTGKIVEAYGFDLSPIAFATRNSSPSPRAPPPRSVNGPPCDGG